MTATRHSIDAFAIRLGAASCPIALSAVNRHTLLADGRTAVAAANRLQDYRDYLARARETAARSRGRGAIDREVYAQARRSLDDVRVLTGSTLHLFASLERGGTLDALVAAAADTVERAGPVHTDEVWKWVTGSKARRRVITDAGVGEPVLRALEAAIPKFGARLSVEGSLLISEGTRTRAALETAPRAPRPTGVYDLLTRGRLEAVAAAVDRGEPAHLAGVGLAGAHPRAADLVLADALETLEAGVQHVRGLEDVGLTLHRGAGGETILALCLLAMVIGAIITVAACHGNDQGGVEGDPSDACLVGLFLSTLGLAVGLSIKPPPGLVTRWATGTGIVHGTLRDFAAA